MRLDWNWTDGVLELEDDESSIVAFRDIQPDEWYLRHHFPRFPVVPGVFLIEAMAHTVGVLQSLKARRATASFHHYVLAAVVSARFYRFARPGQRVVFRATIIDSTLDEVRAKVEASSLEGRLARCELVISRLDLAEVLGDACEVDPFGLANYLRRVMPEDLWARYELTSR
ncbi:MAG TPA: FabA/FabZ family ACP-dehydratase [Polyangiaceae bacterium]|nr:FabA/FabZ family ACP-dehydratase [Polyangiaceae bacterium]